MRRPGEGWRLLGAMVAVVLLAWFVAGDEATDAAIIAMMGVLLGWCAAQR